MARWAWIVAVVAGLAWAGDGGAKPLAIARGKAPRLDGTLASKEWDGATKVDLAGGQALRLRCDDDRVYLGLDATPGIVTVFAHVGKKIVVLHSSARLGTAVYAPDGDAWKNEREFRYEADSEAFLKKEGWRATTMRAGKPGHMEFVLSKKLLGLTAKTRSVRIAVAVFAQRSVGWPAAAKDVTAHPRLLMGYTPKKLAFAPKK